MKIKNWRKFQHYDKRKPLWIKLYRDILDDIRIHKLSDGAFRFLINLILLASEEFGELPEPEEICVPSSIFPAHSVLYSCNNWYIRLGAKRIAPRTSGWNAKSQDLCYQGDLVFGETFGPRIQVQFDNDSENSDDLKRLNSAP